MSSGKKGAAKPPVNFLRREQMRESMTPMSAPLSYTVSNDSVHMQIRCPHCAKPHMVSERAPFDFTMLRAIVRCGDKNIKLLVIAPPELIAAEAA